MNKEQFVGLRFVIVLFLLGLCSLPASSAEAQKTPASASIGVQELSKLKSEAEQLTKRLKRTYGNDSREIKHAENLYIPAKSSIDGWISRVEFDLDRGGKLDDQEYLTALNEAKSKGQAYADYVNGLYSQGALGSAVEAIGTGLKSLADIALNIRKEWQAENDEQRKRLKADLDAQRWQSFDSL